MHTQIEKKRWTLKTRTKIGMKRRADMGNKWSRMLQGTERRYLK